MSLARLPRVLARQRAHFATSALLRNGKDDKGPEKFVPDTSFEVPKTQNPLDLLDLHPSKIKTANTMKEQEIIKKQEEVTHMWWREVEKLEKELAEAKKEAAEKKE